MFLGVFFWCSVWVLWFCVVSVSRRCWLWGVLIMYRFRLLFLFRCFINVSLRDFSFWLRVGRKFLGRLLCRCFSSVFSVVEVNCGKCLV